MNQWIKIGGVLLCAQWLFTASAFGAEGADKAGKMYGDMMCLMSDPKTWEGMFDEQTPEQKAAEEAKAAKFYKDHGYEGEKDASKSVIESWGQKAFKDAVSNAIDSDAACKKRLAEKMDKLKQMLDGPAPKAD